MILEMLQNMSSIARMATMVRAKPFIKWAGGKQGIADSLVRLFPRGYERFFEPFVGGGSVLLAQGAKNAVACDLNDWLLDTYTAIRDSWKSVAKTLDTLPNTKEDFLRIREIDPRGVSLVKRAAYFIYLNKTCFRGLFRVNRKGMFNVPYGAYQRAYYDPVNLEVASLALQTVEFRHSDFELSLHDVTADDFVYLDPPYYKQGGYADFNRYTSGQFREPDHFRLAALCRELDQRGVRWAVSNSDTAFVREIFEGFEMLPIVNRREINLNSQDRSINELLIINYAKPKGERLLFSDAE